MAIDTSKMIYDFIAIEGNIGVGKTSLCKRITEQFNLRLLLEEFSDNPFLPAFYKDPEKHAFPVELFFMAERYQQIQQKLLEKDLFQQQTIADYFFIKTLLFAKENLKEEEYRLFQRFFNILNGSFPKPDLLVYLHRSVDVLLENIKHRGRPYERNISDEYLLKIQNAYFDYFKTDIQRPVLIINLGRLNFLKNDSVYQKIIELINTEYPIGLHRVDLTEMNFN